MRRTLLGIALLLGAGFALVSWETGRRTEVELRARVEALDAGLPLDVSLERYERGLFRSRAVVLLAEPEEAFPDEGHVRLRLRLRHRIDHGPFPLAWLRSPDFDRRPVLARVSARPVLEREAAGEATQQALPFSVEGRFRSGGRATVWIVADADPPALAAAGVSARVSADWQHLRARLHVRDHGSQLAGSVALPRLEVSGEHGALALRDLSYAFDYARASPAGPMLVGEARFSLGLLRVEAAGEVFELRGLELGDASAVEGTSWSLQVQGSFERLRQGDRSHGPGELELRMADLALEPLSELAALARRLESEGTDAEAAGVEAMMAVGVLWPKLMAAGPSLEIRRLRLVTPDGELRMAARLGVDPEEVLLLAHPLMAFSALELDAELSLPQGLLHRWLATPRPVVEVGTEAAPWVAPAELASRRVASWLERGHLQRHDGSYVLAVRVRKGAIRLNGRVVSLDEL